MGACARADLVDVGGIDAELARGGLTRPLRLPCRTILDSIKVSLAELCRLERVRGQILGELLGRLGLGAGQALGEVWVQRRGRRVPHVDGQGNCHWFCGGLGARAEALASAFLVRGVWGLDFASNKEPCSRRNSPS